MKTKLKPGEKRFTIEIRDNDKQTYGAITVDKLEDLFKKAISGKWTIVEFINTWKESNDEKS